MENQEVSKALSIIKPNEVRIEGWKRLLPAIFDWERTSLEKVRDADYSNVILLRPTKEDIPKLKEIETALSETKKLIVLTETGRKDITKALDDLKKRLMIPEKAWEDISKQIEDSYKRLKRIETDERAKVEARNLELQRFRTKVQTKFNSDLAESLLGIEKAVTAIFKEALEDNSNPETLLPAIFERHTEMSFFVQYQRAKEDTEDLEKARIVEEIYGKWDSKSLKSKFEDLLLSTFENFDAALLQKEDAIALRLAEDFEREADIIETKETENAFAVLEEKAEISSRWIGSTYSEPKEATRELKVGYEIDMEDSQFNMLILMKAFFAHKMDCLAMYQGKKYFNIDATAMGQMLCKLKIKDKNFAPDGVVFKKIDKL